MKNILFGISTFGVLATQTACSSFSQSLSQEEFIEFSKKSNTVIIDVRSSKEYSKGHVPSAINFPHRQIVSGKLTFDSFTDKNIVLYCHSGIRASIVDKYLDKNQLFPREQLFHLKGDFRAWKARGRSIVKP